MPQSSFAVLTTLFGAAALVLPLGPVSMAPASAQTITTTDGYRVVLPIPVVNCASAASRVSVAVVDPSTGVGYNTCRSSSVPPPRFQLPGEPALQQTNSGSRSPSSPNPATGNNAPSNVTALPPPIPVAPGAPTAPGTTTPAQSSSASSSAQTWSPDRTVGETIDIDRTYRPRRAVEAPPPAWWDLALPPSTR
ncbi:hypothetical protein [Leptolyngbya sp. FACHB-261]|uniref:hypothetical protein n=1 Tax=Leptolyngbya sp. FACHB-261 TaxID=2692806 RepID=UPI001688321D|nr:hypothetical protein [Leptolyngbya sp. FACHB-261]MBD2101705.1 hypothetical protein [Leptolyngbya sp. FACHB-261]